MATYHCRVKVGGKGKASGHAAYIAREGSYAERAGHEDLEATGHGNLPSWAEHEPSRFWTAADRYERANGATYREIEIALPRELNPDQRQALVLDFIQHEIGERHAHQWAIHSLGVGNGILPVRCFGRVGILSRPWVWMKRWSGHISVSRNGRTTITTR